MKALSRATFLVMLVVIALGIAAAASAQDEAKPTILIEEKRFDFGEIYEQDRYRHEFTVKNTGNADLKIEKVKPG